MNYCEELHNKINEWRKALDELRNLIDGYSEKATEDLKKKIEDQIRKVEELKDEYINYLEKECFEEVEIVDINGQQKTERIFAPEAQALTEIEAIIGRKPKVIVKDRRITEFSVSWYDLPHDKLYPALEILFKRCKNLKILDVSRNQLTSLPPLPKGLTELDCSHNKLTLLPKLPDGLTFLNCRYNQLTSLPPLPDNLRYLYCSNNPELGESLSQIKLPPNLREFSCENTGVTTLPSLPDTLTYINASRNPLTEEAKQELIKFKGKHPNAAVFFDE